MRKKENLLNGAALMSPITSKFPRHISLWAQHKWQLYMERVTQPKQISVSTKKKKKCLCFSNTKHSEIWGYYLSWIQIQKIENFHPLKWEPKRHTQTSEHVCVGTHAWNTKNLSELFNTAKYKIYIVLICMLYKSTETEAPLVSKTVCFQGYQDHEIPYSYAMPKNRPSNQHKKPAHFLSQSISIREWTGILQPIIHINNIIMFNQHSIIYFYIFSMTGKNKD